MKCLWAYNTAFVQPELCEEIIKIVKSRKNLQWGTLNTKNVTDSKMRKSKIDWIHKNDTELNFLFPLIWHFISEANRDCFQLNILELSKIQFSEYSSKYKGHYNTHVDVGWLDINELNLQRKISFIIQLSNPNDYEGGEFYFSDNNMDHPNYDELKRQGTILTFPSFAFHGVKPVLKGTRYSLVGWVEGLPWC